MILYSIIDGIVFYFSWLWFVCYAFQVHAPNFFGSLLLGFFWQYIRPEDRTEPTLTSDNFLEPLFIKIGVAMLFLGIGFLLRLNL